MIGLDTNVIIRYLMQDDELQFTRAEQIIETSVQRGEFLHVCLTVLCEMVWVLDYTYGLKKEEITQFLEMLLHSDQFEVENRELVMNAFQAYQESTTNFADCLIGLANQQQGCFTTYTFDKKAAKLRTFAKL
jgi:predicted nucleic-acid-binding protein